MKFSLVEDLVFNSGQRGYTSHFLEYLCPEIKKFTPAEADVILLSVNDVTQLNWVKRIRKIYPDKPIIAGGSFGFSGETLLAYVDMVNVGEGFEFFQKIRQINFNDAPVSRVMTELTAEPYILTKAKTTEFIKPSTFINWEKVPCVQTGRQSYYFLFSKGCPNKCHFCYTAWTQPFQRIPDKLINQQIAYFTKNRKLRLSLVSNEGYQFEGFQAQIASKSVMVKQFLEKPMKYAKTGMLHIGLEGFSEKARKKIGKPISNLDIIKLLFWTKKLSVEIELFMILGLPEDDRNEFLTVVPRDLTFKPRVHVQFHWLEHHPHTPLWRSALDIPLEPFNRDAWFFQATALNKRFRTRPLKYSAYADWRSFIQRIPYDRVDECMKLQTTHAREDLFNQINDLGLSDYLHPHSYLKLANECIKCPWDKGYTEIFKKQSEAAKPSE